jgi:hypothetical protein
MQLKARHIVAAFRNQVVSATNKTVRYPGWDSRTCTLLYLGIYQDAVAVPISRLSTRQIGRGKNDGDLEAFPHPHDQIRRTCLMSTKLQDD